MLGAVPFKFDRYDDGEFPVEAIGINDRNDPLNCSNSLEPWDPSETGRRRKPDPLGQDIVWQVGILAQDVQNVMVYLIKVFAHASKIHTLVIVSITTRKSRNFSHPFRIIDSSVSDNKETSNDRTRCLAQ